jgi:hypothetical protein
VNPGFDAPVPCLGCLAPQPRSAAHDERAAASGAGFLSAPLPAIADEEGARIPDGLPPVVDAHVHVFPDRLFQAIWDWFDQYGWPVRYRLTALQVIDYQLSRGVEHVVALTYAHKPGIARGLNEFMIALCAQRPQVLGCATVFPGEPDAATILADAFAAGLSGVKLHCHVQCISIDDPRLLPIFETCVAHHRPVIVHAGREPKSPGYRCDPHALCSADRVDRVLAGLPALKLVVPHLGADEFDAYARLMERHPGLWLDTTMAVGGYFPTRVPWDLVESFPGRIAYGTDFPNVPFAWDRELRCLLERKLSAESRAALLGGAAKSLFLSER